MNTYINFNRLGLLLKRFFVENAQKELTFWAISLVVFMIIREPAASGMFIYISGFIFAANVYKSFKYTPGAMHYLLIPATHLEKLFSGILLSVFYFLAGILTTYLIGNILGTYLGNIIFNLNNEVQFRLFETASIMNNTGISDKFNYLLDMFVGFAIVQSIFMLGSIYFKRNSVGKTLLSIIAFSIVIGIIELTLIKFNFDTTSLRNENINFSLIDTNSMFPGSEIIGQIIKYATAPFFWVVSYFRLTEKEV